MTSQITWYQLQALYCLSYQAQIRQQMSTRAEALDEERKKAEMSLEGLKTKLKNLEEVRLFQYRSYLISPHQSNLFISKEQNITAFLRGLTSPQSFYSSIKLEVQLLPVRDENWKTRRKAHRVRSKPKLNSFRDKCQRTAPSSNSLLRPFSTRKHVD